MFTLNRPCRRSPLLRACLACALAVAALGVWAGTAAADPSIGQILINGTPMGSGTPQVGVNFSFDGGGQWVLDLTNANSNQQGLNITSVSGTIGPSASAKGYSLAGADEQTTGSSITNSMGISFAGNGTEDMACDDGEGGQTSFSCPSFFGGFGPGADQLYVIHENEPDAYADVNGLATLNIQMAAGACVNNALARVSWFVQPDNNCALPGQTTITSMKVNQQKRTAQFAYHSPHAITYECELLTSHHVMFRNSCGSQKAYRHGLPKGSYTFLVWGTNTAGIGQKAAGASFTIKG